MLRIAYLTTHYPNVAHTFIQGEILALAAGGAEIVPVALNAPDSDDILTDVDRSERARTLYVKALPKSQIAGTVAWAAARHPVPFLRCLLRAFRAGGLNLALSIKTSLQFVEAVLVWRHCRDRGITAVHAHFGQAPASVAWLTAEFGNAIGEDHWTWSVTIHGSHEFFTEDTALVRQKMRWADLVVCISDFTRAQLMRIAEPEDWSKISIVRCGIDFDAFPVRAPRAPSEAPVVVTVARLSREKGLLVLVEAIARLRAQNVPATARIIGHGPFRPQLEAAVTRLGVTDAVELTGAMPPDEVAVALRDADVFCLPTFFEGLPISIMEAMAIGVPVVTTFVGAIPELVVDGETGWLVPAGNAELLADAIREALTSPDRDQVIKVASERVRHRHDRAASMAELAPLLQRCHAPGATLARSADERATAALQQGVPTEP